MVQRCSNEAPFLVLEPEPSVRTGIRVDIFDGADPNTLLAVLPDTWARSWTDPLKGPGSGTFKVYASNEKLLENPDLLAYGNIARFSLDEVYRFAITIEKKHRVQVGPAEDASQVLTVAGRGVLAKLEEAQVYLSGGLTGDAERTFDEVGAGPVILDLVGEAQARSALSGITTDFTDAVDSNNAPWDIPLEITERAGTDLLRVALRHAEAWVDINMTPDLTLQYFNMLGIDRSVQYPSVGPVILQPADNIVELARDESGSIRNVLLIETPAGFLERTEAASVTAHRRREAFLSLGNVADSDAVDRAAESVFAQIAEPAAQITIEVTDKEGARPYVDWDKGYWVLAPDADGSLARYRVKALTVSETETGQPRFVPELATITEELETRLERWLAAMAKGTLAGSAGNVAEPVKAPVEVTNAIDAGIGDHTAGQPHHDELADLADTDLTGLTDQDLLQYDAGAGDWVPLAFRVDLSTPPTDGQLLEYDNGADRWVPTSPAAGVTDLDDLSDVDVSSTPPTDQQALIYDDGSGLWVPGDVAAGGGDPIGYAETIGDGVATNYEITHSLGTEDVLVSVYDISGADPVLVETDVTVTGANTIEVDFSSAPASNSHRVVVVSSESTGGGGGSSLDTGRESFLARRTESNAEDDHFNAATLNAKWTTPAGFTADLATMPGWLIPTANFTTITQPVPAGDWIIECECMMPNMTAANYLSAGLAIQNGAQWGTSQSVVYFLGSNNSLTVFRHAMERFTNGAYQATYNQVTSDHGDASYGFLRIQKVGTTYSVWRSVSGHTWQVQHSTTIPFTPTHFGLFGGNGSRFNYFVRR